MSRPPLKALEQIKNYCEKIQCRRCVFGEKAEMLSDDLDYVGCKLQQDCPCEWNIKAEIIEKWSDSCSKEHGCLDEVLEIIDKHISGKER